VHAQVRDSEMFQINALLMGSRFISWTPRRRSNYALEFSIVLLSMGVWLSVFQTIYCGFDQNYKFQAFEFYCFRAKIDVASFCQFRQAFF
jgi:hypothetical protein